jgi:hypothetical protein
LTAYWRLDEGVGDIAYDSAGDKAGVLIGGPVWRPGEGKGDGALEFDGVDDYVSTPFVLNPGFGPFSVFAWIKGGAPGQVIISQLTGANWLMVDAEGELMTELKSLGRTGAPLQSQAVIIDGHWHRVALVWDGSNRTLYVDDVEVARDTQPALRRSEGDLYFGTGKNLEPGIFFSGLIDDVRIYNRAITP